MKQAITKHGKVVVEEVPAPQVAPGTVLIRVVNSCVSAGTEIGAVQNSGKSLLQRALEQPENLRKALGMAKTIGLAKTYARIRGIVDGGLATGYSAAGVVVAVGHGVTRFAIGDQVAAAGAGYANHAEYAVVPQSLVVEMPGSVNFAEASTVALGSIALHAARRAELRLGEFCCVVGAGILGLISVQILKSSGVRVAVVDVDPSRLTLAEALGAELTIDSMSEDPVPAIENWTSGFGADAVLFTAATSSSDALSQSFRMSRRKGRVVLVGVSGLEVKREDIYAKELDFLVSTSYGPGRYDRAYEEQGADYPYAYVRWTENRNMSEYLRLIAQGAVRMETLISSVFPIQDVTSAYETLQRTENRPLIVLLDYGKFEAAEASVEPARIAIRQINCEGRAAVRVALVGAGGFATAMHLPNMQRLSGKFQIEAVMSRNGHRAKSAAQQYGARYATSRFEEVIADPRIDLVMICTRHDSHAELTLKALESGKHVFVEKPLATSAAELEPLKAFYANVSPGMPLTMVGFNRRFSQYSLEIKRRIAKRVGPLLIHYRMNSGYLASDHWVHESGGRIIGEACHVIDLMTYFTGCRIAQISCSRIDGGSSKFRSDDNVAACLKYEDGSVCTIQYTALGSRELGKEYLELHFDEKSIVMNDFRQMQGFGMRLSVTSRISEKGQLEELEALYRSLRYADEGWPIDWWDLVQTTEATFRLAN